MAQNQVYLIKSGENSFVEETQAIVGISGGKVGIGTTHPEADLHVTGSVKVGGDLTVDGTLTTINSTTVSVDDKNIELGGTDNPTDDSAEGGGITVKGANDKTFNWYAASGWTSSENLSVADGKHFAGDELRALDAGGLSLFDTNQSGITIKGGKVGIHKTAPGYDLDVDGSGNFGSLYVDGNAVLTGEGSIFGKWEDGATQGEIFYTGGNVGVGTINPEHKFHVVGSGVVDGDFVVNGNSSTFNVGEFDVSGSNITLNSAGGGLDSSRGGLIVNAGTNKTFQYVDGSDFWQSSESMQIVADKHLQTDKVRAIDDGGLYLQDDGGNGIHIQDGGQVNIAGLTKANGGLNVGNGKFDIQSDGTLGSVPPNPDDVIKWDGNKWVADVSPGGGGGGTSEVPNALINSLIAGESIQEITYGPYDSTPRIATDLEIVGDGSVIPYALSGVSETGYFAVFSQEIPNNNYKIHTVFGGKDVYWETGSSSSIYYNDGDVSLQRNLTVGGNLTVAGNTTTLNTQTLEIEDHNIVIASNTGYNQLTDVYPVGGDYAGVFWGTGDAGAASPVSLTYQSNKGFAFEGGNVGIGTTSPTDKLDIASNSENLGITVTNSSTSPARITLINTEGSANIDCNDNLLRLGNNTSKDLVIDSAGRVGIGTTNPEVILDVDGKIQIQSDQFWFKGGSFRFVDRNTGDSVERMCIDSSGNVGIGTTNPSDELHINSAGSNVNLRLTRDDDTGGRISCSDGADTPVIIFETIASDVRSERMRIDSDGNVGIGATNPVGKLHVTDLSVSIGNVTVTNTGTGVTGGTDLNTKISDGDRIKINGEIFTVSDVAETTLTLSGTPSTAGTFTAYTDSHGLVVTSAGNVGIGTTNPGAGTLGGKVVHLANSGASASMRVDRTDATVAGSLSIVAGSGTNGIYSTGSKGLTIGTDSTTRMLIDSDGNVGIGTTDPSCRFHVRSGDEFNFNIDESTAHASARFTATAGERTIALMGSAATKSNYIGSLDPDHSLRFFTTRKNVATRTTHMTITEGGNVGIGTASPDSIVSASTTTNAFAYIKTNGYGVFTSNSSGPGVYVNKTNASLSESTDYINFRNKGLIAGSIEYDGTDVILAQASDARLKENIKDSGSGLNIVNNLQIRSFDWVGEKRKSKRFGFIAQEMHKVFEEAVKVGGEDENEEPWAVSDLKLIPVLTKAIQEQQQLIDDLKSQNESLAARISALES